MNENNNENIDDINNNNDIQKNLDFANDEFSNILQTKESKEFTNRLRASILANNNIDNNLNNNKKEGNI